MPTKMAWTPIVATEYLPVGEPELFVMQLQRAFPGEFPLILTATKHLDRLEGMAAVDTSFGNPYLKLIQEVKRYKNGVSIWPERQEEK